MNSYVSRPTWKCLFFSIAMVSLLTGCTRCSDSKSERAHVPEEKSLDGIEQIDESADMGEESYRDASAKDQAASNVQREPEEPVDERDTWIPPEEDEGYSEPEDEEPYSVFEEDYEDLDDY